MNPSSRMPRLLSIYLVERVDGPLLWLKAKGGRTSGWAAAADVVSIEQAVDFFTAQIRTHPHNAFPYASALSFTLTRDELDSPSATSTRPSASIPNTAARCGRGTTWLSKKQFDKAIADFDEAIRLDPKNTVAYIGRGNSHEAGSSPTPRPSPISAKPSGSILCRSRPISTAAMLGSPRKSGQKPSLTTTWSSGSSPSIAGPFRGEELRGRPRRSTNGPIADFDEAARIDPHFAEAHRAVAWLLATCPIVKLRDKNKAVESATKSVPAHGLERRQFARRVRPQPSPIRVI